DGRALHSMENDRQYGHADRTVRGDADHRNRSRQRRFHLLYGGDPRYAYLRPLRLRLGMPRRCTPRSLRMDDEKDRHYAAAVSFAAFGLCSAACCVLYVRMADAVPHIPSSAADAASSRIHESSAHRRFLDNLSDACGGNTFL